MNKFFLFFVSLLFTYNFSQVPSLVKISPINEAAIRYVGNTHAENGAAQLELLLKEGLSPEHYVLEIGCGALVAGISIMSFLAKGHYCGIEPNKWLFNDSLKVTENKAVADKCEPRFLTNENFDGTDFNVQFDYIISHSIMSHAAYHQLPLFLKNCAKVLKPGGKVIFSIRLTKPNKYGSNGASAETKDSLWQYPGNSYFDESTVVKEAGIYFSLIKQKELYTKLITDTDRGAFHDWFVLTK